MDGYYSLNRYLQEQFGHKVYRLLVDAGTGCPNRDSTLSLSGCSFCKSGNQEFSEKPCTNMEEQFSLAKKRIAGKTKADLFIAYFGVGSATYGNIDYLESIYQQAIRMPDVVCLSLGTRPDCLSNDVLDMLERINQIKPVWVELGLQTIHERTAQAILRGYPLETFDKATEQLKARRIQVIPHLIFGLPGESRKDMLSSVSYVAHKEVSGIKLHLLSILRGTLMEKEYITRPWQLMTIEEYASLLFDAIELLPENMVVHRFTGDGAKSDLIEPLWSADKKNVLNTINRFFRKNHLQQGIHYLQE